MSNDLPATVPFSDVEAALASVGIAIDHTLSVEFDRKSITVVRARTDDQGRLIAAGDELATVTTTIGIDRS